MNFIKYFFKVVFKMSQKLIGLISVLFIALTFLVTGNSFAQNITATASVDTTAIQIGGQFILSLEVNHPADIKIEWPAVPDTFALFELVQQVPADTSENKSDKSVTNRQHFKITSFDSGYHVIPPFEFLYRLKGDTTFQKAETRPILINVQSIAVDTTKAIKDIKGNVVIPFSWQDALPYAGSALLAGLVFLLIYFLFKKYRHKKQTPVIQVPKRPAHEIAIEALEQLDASKLWQQGNYKGYFTGLSDITRMFIQNRWSVNAMEMTTDEILRLRIISGQDQMVFDQLKQMLELADLVKFAKVIPVHHENEISMKQAFAFVKANQQLAEIQEVAP